MPWLNEVMREIADVGGFSYIVEEMDLAGTVSCIFTNVNILDFPESILATNGYRYYYIDRAAVGIGVARSLW